MAEALQLERAAAKQKARAERVECARAIMEKAAKEAEERAQEDGLLGMPRDVLCQIVQIVEQIDKFWGTALASTCNFFILDLGGWRGRGSGVHNL